MLVVGGTLEKKYVTTSFVRKRDPMRPRRWSSTSFTMFFSSRRRHTRFDCDWSSDVCSSDLVVVAREHDPRAGLRRQRIGEAAADRQSQVFLHQAIRAEIGRASCRERV